MLKKTITYTDFEDVERTEDFYFNLTKSEIMEMDISTEGGLVAKIKQMIAAKNGAEIMKTFKYILSHAYGEKSLDGRRFQKSPEIFKSFEETNAYDVLFMELITDEMAAANFINSLIPKDLKTT